MKLIGRPTDESKNKKLFLILSKYFEDAKNRLIDMQYDFQYPSKKIRFFDDDEDVFIFTR